MPCHLWETLKTKGLPIEAGFRFAIPSSRVDGVPVLPGARASRILIPSRAMMDTQTLTTIRIAHSPDSDDAFMFYDLTQGAPDAERLEIRIDGLEIQHVHQD